ncbi:SLAP domain-containing protein [Companilactobacillus zhongbaensis]|uniref:SLAP domain-containing protein n=1 Tax=Companilactobacillus zhongbaensis TaxID=2486009 RepID=UPI000F77E55E|nr:SLAP domain-containing protein [Companilactobacillus zhongbaensis]
MKITKSYIVKGLIFSGIVLGTIGLQSTIVDAVTDAGIDAATKTTDVSTNKISNQLIFVSGNVEVGSSSTTVTGDKVGQKIDLTKVIPDGYQVASGDTDYTLAKDGTINRVDLEKVGDVTATVHYIYNNGSVGTETVSGKAGETVSVSKVPSGYYLVKASDQKVVLGSGSSDIYLNVSKAITNTISFVNNDEAKTEVGTAVVSGKEAGATVDLTADQIPTGYTILNPKWNTITLQPDGTKQQVTVKKDTTVVENKGTVSTYGKLTPLYSADGKSAGSRSLGANSEWATDKKMTLNGEDYYRVSTEEWVKASDVYEYTANETNVTIKDGNVAHLYDTKGNQLTQRSVAPNSVWYSDRTINVDGQTYYRVSTTEWVSAADIK